MLFMVNSRFELFYVYINYKIKLKNWNLREKRLIWH